jgi:polyvinyl alcohol dehydrogenase (cytochrome)
MPGEWRLKHNLGCLVALIAFGLVAACSEDAPANGATGSPAQPSALPGAPPATAAPTSAAKPAPGTPPGPGAATPAPDGTPPPATTPTMAVPPGGATPPPDPAGAPPPAAGSSPNWIGYGNGYKNQFLNTAETKISVETAPMLKQLWMVTPGEVTAAPTVVGDKLYVSSNAGLYGLNAADGSTIWTANIRSTSGAFYDEETKMLYVASSGGAINGVDSETGAIKWMERISDQASTNGWSSPIVVGNLVVLGCGAIDMGTYLGGLSAFDKMTGAKAWEYKHTTTNGASIWSGPGADDDGIIYATTGNNYGTPDDRSDSVFALDPAKPTEFIWNTQCEQNDAWTFSGGTGPDHDFGANPIIVDYMEQKIVAAGQKSGVFHAFDRMTGKELWSQKLCTATGAANGGILNNGAFDGQRFIAAANESSAPGKMAAMDALTGKIVWEKPMTGVSWAPISAANGVCFVPDNTTLRVMNCATGDELASLPTPGTIGSGPAISDGHVYVGSGFNYSLGSVVGGRNLVAFGLE